MKRHPERGVYDRATIDAILDEALICHVGFLVDGQAFVIPTIHARDGDVLYAKIRGGPPSDDEVDLSLPVWAGVIPLELTPATPASDKGGQRASTRVRVGLPPLDLTRRRPYPETTMTPATRIWAWRCERGGSLRLD